MYCNQRTYASPKSFRYTTYKKRGLQMAFGGGAVPVPTREPSRNSRRYFRKARQLRSVYALLLDEHLESLSHPFRVNQRLELQPRFGALRLGLTPRRKGRQTHCPGRAPAE